MCLSGLINFQFNNLQSAFDIRVDPRNKNQEIRLNSAWLEILVLAFFNVSLLLHSSIGFRCSTLVSVRISYLVFPFSSSSFFNRRSTFDIGLDSVFRTSYFYFVLSTWYFVQSFLSSTPPPVSFFLAGTGFRGNRP